MPRKAQIEGPYDWDCIVATKRFEYKDEQLSTIAATLPRSLEKQEIEKLNFIASCIHRDLFQSKKRPPNSVVEQKLTSIKNTAQKIIYGDKDIRQYALNLCNQLMIYESYAVPLYGYVPLVLRYNLNLCNEKANTVIAILGRVIEASASPADVSELKVILNRGFEHYGSLQKDLKESGNIGKKTPTFQRYFLDLNDFYIQICNTQEQIFTDDTFVF